MKNPKYNSVIELLERLKEDGFDDDFVFKKSQLLSLKTGRFLNAEDLIIRESFRFEGASDPDDMSIVYTVETTDGLRGVVIDAFGTYGNPELQEFLARASDQRPGRAKSPARAANE